jgi:hypothetical protein
MTNKEHCKKYYLNHKEMFSKYQKKQRKLVPWKFTLVDIKTRCNNKKSTFYSYYGGRGIKCLITSDELKELWFRDKAYLLKVPSINRIDNNDNYTFDNCEYIEKGINSAERNRRVSSKPILQFDLDGKFIKEWNSITEASKALSINNSHIGECARNYKNIKQSGGFIWRFK